ncbi:MAG: ABC transporter ATP-binding protein [Oscillospiraceae bacterium]|nr:ABC transporter ATP-binding protein [Oscillospiraceae bacterium]
MSLQISSLAFSYGAHEVLRDISFTAAPGLTAVLGQNGAGKTTLFRCILGTLTASRGTVLADGTDLRALSPRSLARKVAFIPQAHHPAFSYSVSDVVLMGTTASLRPLGMPGTAQREAAQWAMEQIGILPLAARSFSALSGGEQQLVMIARALSQKTGILIMDEPASGLDYGNQIRVMRRVKTLASQGYTILFSSHDPQSTLLFADAVLALRDGGVEAFGPPSEVLTEELLRKLYGVSASIETLSGRRVILPPVLSEDSDVSLE